jgi:hypothetical protein
MSAVEPEGRRKISEEQREDLLEVIDEVLDDTPKGRRAKKIVEEMPSEKPEQID